ncbi:hypothetical protein F511_09212 [Dorcoceras hygrometricum]|uniref:Uncharacterized protein n=1 Tax=Dorcoceras hygrometricum TaxID=472368 RepID=A0A2Z7CNX9_9LAMI|nr:hypothetical protein F511_09212 [Dorcoceras hygrometricum]
MRRQKSVIVNSRRWRKIAVVKKKPAGKQAQSSAMFKSRKKLNKSSTDEVSISSVQTRTEISWCTRTKLVMSNQISEQSRYDLRSRAELDKTTSKANQNRDKLVYKNQAVLICEKVINPAEALNDKGHKVQSCQKTFQLLHLCVQRIVSAKKLYISTAEHREMDDDEESVCVQVQNAKQRNAQHKAVQSQVCTLMWQLVMCPGVHAMLLARLSFGRMDENGDDRGWWSKARWKGGSTTWSSQARDKLTVFSCGARLPPLCASTGPCEPWFESWLGSEKPAGPGGGPADGVPAKGGRNSAKEGKKSRVVVGGGG